MVSSINSYGTKEVGAFKAAASLSLLSLTKSISALSIPIVTAYTLATLPKASACVFVDCMNACDKIEAEILKLACYGFCWWKCND